MSLATRTTAPEALDKFSVFASCVFATCVSLGAAMVSLSKIFILIAVIWRLIFEVRCASFKRQPQSTWTILAVFLSLTWMFISFAWTEAPSGEAVTAMLRHSRLMWLIAVFYLLQTSKQGLAVLKFVVVGQFFVVICSWLMWLGVYIPWAKKDFPPEMGILFTSTLEQPVMSSLMLLLLWFFRDQWPVTWHRVWLWAAMSLTLLNVLFIMTGRTGFLVILLLIATAAFWELPKRYRWGVVALPFLLGATLLALSPRFQSKMMEIKRDVALYQNGNFDTSQGQRLDYWHRSIIAVIEKPIIGHGVGSWKTNYLRLGGLQNDPPSNPHQQYLLWLVEAGAIGLALFISIFIALYKDALNLSEMASRALISTIIIAAFMGLMNCPFFGVGMGEYFMAIIGSLLIIKNTADTRMLN
ncbi:MAG: O-antigen ligase family protein [Rhodoferax sp.]|uniref:O-antigen ligase family protein n=1 Tax=Rhodoferax sp. TaxID=50421 RepID=UPI0030179795